MLMTGCRHFNGYKPCGKSLDCTSTCAHLNIPKVRVIVIGLEALGAVVRFTTILPAIRRKYPDCHITWVTQAPAEQILLHHTQIDRLLTTTQNDLLALSALTFDIAFVLDKSLKSSGILKQTTADLVFGFIADSYTGAIMPATSAADELWEIGLNDQKKFFENQKSEAQLICESLELEYKRDEYSVHFTDLELKDIEHRKKSWSAYGETLIGINTGCSGVIPYKKLSIESHRILIKKLMSMTGVRIVLLGGKEDTIRNQQIGQGFDLVQSETDQGLRDGMKSIAACDVIVTGDSLGLHLGVALKKWVVAWFGPTCAHEIDLYGRGSKILAKVECGPCWKRTCQKEVMCYDLVDINELHKAVLVGVNKNAEKSSDHTNSISW
jgi:heptosyltransferase-2